MKKLMVILLLIMTVQVIIAQDKQALLIGISRYSSVSNSPWSDIHGKEDVSLIAGFQTIFQGADGFPWKACERQKRFASSNLALSASKRLIFNRLQSQKHFFVRH